MSFLQSIILGIIQGLTEFLPVSSSGHLVLAGHFFGLEERGDIVFEIFLHLGTALAVIVFYRKTLWELLKSLFIWKKTIDSQVHYHNRMMIIYILVATLATIGIYLPFNDILESLFSEPLIVAIMLSVTGVIVFSSDLIKDRAIPARSMGLMRSVFIGIGQGIAIIPGISRSGTTISFSLMTGIKRQDAAMFSFLLSLPAILGANIIEFKALAMLEKAMLMKYVSGFLCSFLVGYAVIAILIDLIRRSKLKYFAFYCWFVSIITVSYLYFS